MMGCKPRLLVLCLFLSLASFSPPRSATAETAHLYDGRWAVTFLGLSQSFLTRGLSEDCRLATPHRHNQG
jgi:hypothetical protein